MLFYQSIYTFIIFPQTPGSLNGGADNKDLENMRSELEARSKWEVSQKLSEVNAYLQSQAQQQDRLYRMQETNEAELRRDFEKTRKELLVGASLCVHVSNNE